jgi:hypothetical protein
VAAYIPGRERGGGVPLYPDTAPLSVYEAIRVSLGRDKGTTTVSLGLFRRCPNLLPKHNLAHGHVLHSLQCSMEMLHCIGTWMIFLLEPWR